MLDDLFVGDKLEWLENKAIEILRHFEPHALEFNPNGYDVGFSGGKDSIVVLDLVRRAGVKHTVHYSVTTIDPPELIYFIRENYPDVVWRKPEKNFFTMVEKRGLPSRTRRWCCDVYKERSSKNCFVVTGVRGGESVSRSKRRQFESCSKYADRRFLHPIFHFSDEAVWAYIKKHNLQYCSLYDEGFERLGCIGCPMAGGKRLEQFRRWPRFAEKWRVAAGKYYDSRKEKGSNCTKKFKDGDEFFDWWLSDKPYPKEFENELGFQTDAKGFFV